MKTFVIHVSDDFLREKHVKSQLAKTNLAPSFMLKGDKLDLSENVLSKYFAKDMKDVSSTTSCAYKHILSYEDIVKNQSQYALIIEDDIIFYNKFNRSINLIIDEIKKKEISNYIISIEDSLLKYIDGSKRVTDQLLYPRQEGRMAGAYLIDFNAAQNILLEISNQRCDCPIDIFHNHCSKKGLIDIYWAQPTLTLQASLEGSLATLIDDKKSGFFRIISFTIQKFYKRTIYRLR